MLLLALDAAGGPSQSSGCGLLPALVCFLLHSLHKPDKCMKGNTLPSCLWQTEVISRCKDRALSFKRGGKQIGKKPWPFLLVLIT